MFFFGNLKCSCFAGVLPEELLSVLQADILNLPEGKNILIPDKLWVNRFNANIRSAQGRNWEAHHDFADLQMVLQGSEFCLLDDPEACISVKPYDQAGDCEMFTHAGKDFHSVLLTPGTALLIPPPVVHLPDVSSSAFSGTVPKLVAKIHRSLLKHN